MREQQRKKTPANNPHVGTLDRTRNKNFGFINGSNICFSLRKSMIEFETSDKSAIILCALVNCILFAFRHHRVEYSQPTKRRENIWKVFKVIPAFSSGSSSSALYFMVWPFISRAISHVAVKCVFEFLFRSLGQEVPSLFVVQSRT